MTEESENVPDKKNEVLHHQLKAVQLELEEVTTEHNTLGTNIEMAGLGLKRQRKELQTAEQAEVSLEHKQCTLEKDERDEEEAGKNRSVGDTVDTDEAKNDRETYGYVLSDKSDDAHRDFVEKQYAALRSEYQGQPVRCVQDTEGYTVLYITFVCPYGIL